jgi:hypothetical protein
MLRPLHGRRAALYQLDRESGMLVGVAAAGVGDSGFLNEQAGGS